MTQKEMVKDWIQKAPITSWEAFQELGVTRLAEYIRQLRVDDRMNIETETTTRTNRYGKKVSFAKYRLVPTTLFG